MTDGDALLSYLNAVQSGSKARFDRAVSQISPAGTIPAIVARALCTRGLIEVYWEGDKSWLAAPTTFVPLPNQPDRHLVVGLLGDTLRSALANAGLHVVDDTETLVSNLVRTRSVVEGPFRTTAEKVGWLDDPQMIFFYDDTATKAPADLLTEALPNVREAVRSKPLVDPSQIRGAKEFRVYRADRLEEEITTEIDIDGPITLVTVIWPFEHWRTYVVGLGECRQVERGLGISYVVAQAGNNFFEPAGDIVTVDARVTLPILVERAMFLAGATRTYADGLATYSPVPNALAKQLAYRLGCNRT